MVPGKGPI